MKKILQINPVLRVTTSTGRMMQEIGELALKNGWESYIAYSFGRDGLKQCKSQLVPIGNKWSVICHGLATRMFDRHGLSSIKSTAQFIHDIEKIHPDIIHIHNIHGYFLNYQLLFNYLSQSEIPVVWTVHDCWLYTGHCYHYSYVGCTKWKIGCGNCPQKRSFPKSWFIDRSRQNYVDKKRAFTSLHLGQLIIVPVSYWIYGEMQQSFFKDYTFRVIHNGIDMNIFRPCESNEIRKKYGLGNKHIILGIASIWNEQKGLNDFLELSKYINYEEQIVLVGSGLNQQTLLSKNILSINCISNVQHLAELYSIADVFVNPTWQDNYPTVNLESIACGTPVITYHTGGSVEVITKDTGIIVEQGDIHGLLHAIKKIEKKGKDFYRPRCREYAMSNFKKEERYADYLKLYDELLSRKRGV